jgi:hypothetical protein
VSIAADLSAGPPTRQVLCLPARILADLDPAEAKALSVALDGADVSPEWVAEVLRKNGHQITGGTIRRHRRRLCRCP